MTTPTAQLPTERPAARRSKYNRWRALVLAMVILLILVHMGHFLIAGWTLTVFDPAELMSFLEMGLVNVGVVFTVVLIVGTLLFGRFFCGWACHIMAFEDATVWLLNKAGITLKPVRSRLLWLAPFVAMFYMYFWPQLERWWAGRPFPAVYTEWTTTDVWAANPGWIISILTLLTCSIMIVYVLGSRSFCRYACPYGAGLALLQRFSFWRVRLAGDCAQCGRCTENCSSDVAVHEELAKYGQVVSHACVRDLNCVGSCPNQAITFGAGRPLVFQPAAASVSEAASTHYTWWEECLLAVVFATSLFAFRGLYDQIPFLMSLGCSAIVAFLVLELLRLGYHDEVVFQTITLKTVGRLHGAGWLYAVCATLVLAFVVHSGLWQYHRWMGERYFSRTPWMADTASLDREQAAEAVDRAHAHFGFCARFGLVPTMRVELKLGGLALLLDRPVEAEAHFARAIRIEPESAEGRYHFASALLAQGRFDEAMSSLKLAIATKPDYHEAYVTMGSELVEHGDPARAVRVLTEAIGLVPDCADVHFQLGIALTKLEDTKGAIAAMERTLAIDPEHADAHNNLGLLLAGEGAFQRALGHYEAALLMAPDAPLIHYNYGRVLAAADRLPAALEHFRIALSKRPGFAEAHHNCGAVLFALGRVDEASEQFEAALRIDPDDADAHNALAFALAAKGDEQAATQHYKEAVRLNPRHAEARSHLAVLLLQRGELAEAHYEFAVSLSLVGEQEAATQHLDQAHLLNPAYPGTLAELTARLGFN